MGTKEEFLIYKNVVSCIIFATCCITSALAVALHFWEGDWNGLDFIPIVFLLGRSATYIYGAIQYSIMLKRISKINHGGMIDEA